MTVLGWIQILVFAGIVAALVLPLGAYMTQVFEGERTFLTPVVAPVERLLYRLAGIDPGREQSWVDLRSGDAGAQPRRLSCGLRAAAAPARPTASTPRAWDRSLPTWPSTRRSAS